MAALESILPNAGHLGAAGPLLGVKEVAQGRQVKVSWGVSHRTQSAVSGSSRAGKLGAGDVMLGGWWQEPYEVDGPLSWRIGSGL